MTETLNELFELSPVNLSFYGSTEGIEIFSNEKILNTVKTYIYHSPSIKAIYNKVVEGMDNKRILIGYVDKSKLNFVRRRALSKINIRYEPVWKNLGPSFYPGITYGWFSGKDNNISIILDNNVDVFGKSLRNIPSILIHEMFHMQAFNNPELMFSKNKDVFVKFYRTFLKNIDSRFNMIISEDIENFIKNLIKNESNENTSVRLCIDAWSNLLSKCIPGEDSKHMGFLICLPYLFLYTDRSNNLSIEHYTESKKYVRQIITIFHKAYESLGVNSSSYTTPCQEALFPSEILSIIQQVNPTPKTISSINSMDLSRR